MGDEVTDVVTQDVVLDGTEDHSITYSRPAAQYIFATEAYIEIVHADALFGELVVKYVSVSVAKYTEMDNDPAHG